MADPTLSIAGLDGADETFLRRAVADADLNALRLALYQATGDEELARIPVAKASMRGGAITVPVVGAEARGLLLAKLIAHVRNGAPAGAAPSDADLRRMMEMAGAAPLSDSDFAYRRDFPAFDAFPRGASWTGEAPAPPAGFKVAIIGAGFSGIATAIQLERLGIPYVIYERRHEIGGTWSINTYPDARVDTSNFIYQFSFVKNYPWKEYFSRQPDIRAYIADVAEQFGVTGHIRLDHDVTAARFDEQASVWRLDIDGVGEATANVVVAASGLFSTPKTLEVPGAETFAGEIVHTARWRGDIPLAGRKVAIIGNGSTGVQLLAKVAREAAQVTVFQRTAQWISPRERYGEPIAAEERWLLDNVPHYWNWRLYNSIVMGLFSQPLQELDAEWQAGGGRINRPNDLLRESLSDYIRDKLKGRPDLIAKVMPKNAPFARRPIVDNGWYDALLRDNVELVAQGVARIEPGAVVAADGQAHEADLIIAAIGFETTRYVWPMDYIGPGGSSLNAFWEAHGTRSYLGCTVPGFPNLFLRYGPNSQPRASPLMGWQEIWARNTAQMIVQMVETGAQKVEVRRDIFERYNTEMDLAAQSLVWGEPNSRAGNYYLDARGRSSVNAPWRVEDYYARIYPPKFHEYEFS